MKAQEEIKVKEFSSSLIHQKIGKLIFSLKRHMMNIFGENSSQKKTVYI